MLQEVKMLLPKYKCKIDGKRIIRVNYKPMEYYNPFDFYGLDNEQSLYLKFASIDLNNDENILNFINTYGFLGFNKRGKFHTLSSGIILLEEIVNNEDFDFTSESRITPIKDFLKILSNEAKTGLEGIEAIDAISNEVIKMRNILNLSEKLQSDNVKEVYDALINVDCGYSDLLPDEKMKDNIDFVKFVSTHIIKNLVNKEITSVKPLLDVDGSPSSKSLFKGIWEADTLLSAMYIMLYMDLLHGKTSRKCKNITCSQWFPVYGIDKRKIFCTANCAQAHASREYRKRKRKRV